MKTKKALVVILCLVLAVTFAVSFSACNKDKKEEGPSESELRNSACIDLTVALLGRFDSDWGGLLNDEQVQNLDNGGDYILAYEWTDFFVEAVKSSGVQTAKITKATNFVLSDDGAKIFSDSLDINAIAKLMREIGVTSDDAKDIAFNVSRSLVTDSDGVFERAIERLNSIPLSANARENAVKVKNSCTNSLDSLDALIAEKDSVATSLDNAENGLKALFAFAYKSADLLAGDELFVDKLSSGTLGGVTMDEIVTYLNGVKSSLNELQNVLTDDEVEKLGSALGAVNDYLGSAVFANETINSAVSGLKYAYLASDYIVTVCDLIYSVGDFVLTRNLEGTAKDYQTLSDFITVNSGEEYANESNNANNTVLAIRATMFALGVNPYLKNVDNAKYEEQVGTAKQKALDLFDEFVSTSEGVYEKEILLIYASSAINQDNNEKVLGDGITVARVGEILQKIFALSMFEGAYQKYAAGNTEIANTIRDTAKTLIKYYSGEDVALGTSDYTASWYNEVVAKSTVKIQSELDAVLPAVKADLRNHFTEYVFGESFDELVDVSVENPVKIADEGYNQLVNKLESVFGL